MAENAIEITTQLPLEITLQLPIVPFLLPSLPLVLIVLDRVPGIRFLDERLVLSSIFVHFHSLMSVIRYEDVPL